MARRKIDKQALASLIRESKELSNDQKADLLQLLNEQKRYGLVWEQHKEDAEELLEEKIPVLVERTPLRLPRGGESSPNHILIEGDNLHALTALTYTHEGKVDVIYIDPPYNTGAKNWKYNNNYVDGTDGYKHSKWLSMMYCRLIKAKRLLSDRGILILTIDDYEIENITLLLNEIMGEENHLGTIVIKNNPSGRSTVSGFSVAHEYGLFYCKNAEYAKIGRLSRDEDQIGRYKERDDIGYYEWVNFRARYSTNSPSLQYPIYIKKDGSSFRLPKMEYINGKYTVYESPEEDEDVKYPIDATGKMRSWKWGIDTLYEKAKTDIGIRLDQNKEYTLYAKSRLKDEGMLPLTWWDKSEYSSTSMGNNLLASILGGKLFDYPKSLYAVIDSLKVANAQKDSLILDFFAGSGTTLHATMQLNAEDGGHRQCILVTNNENNICEEVTYERNKRVINGYTTPKGVEVPGLTNNNLRYYKTAFVPREKTAANRHALMNMSTDLLCIKENMYNEQPFEIDGKKMKPEFVRYFVSDIKDMVIIYDPRAVSFVAKVLPQDSQKKIMVYVYSDGQYAYNDEFRGKNIELCALPDAIYQALSRVLPTPLLSPEGEDEIPSKDNNIIENSNFNTSPRGGQEGVL